MSEKRNKEYDLWKSYHVQSTIQNVVSFTNAQRQNQNSTNVWSTIILL